MGGPLLLGLVGVGVVLVALALLAWHGRRTHAAVGGAAAVGSFALATVLTLGLIQLVPYGRDHSNPPTIGEPAWSSPQTRELMVNACFGCHSNEVEWPWYSSIAPISWVVTQHVDEGRDEVNYSEFTVDQGEAEETIETIREGEMPPSYYTVFGLHPEAKLSDQEIADLIAGLQLTPGMDEDD
ncbi:MAG: heme-binding domain-containing protein [bacterium]|nr:heme-binding domain-containing protein [bacterium]MCP4966973.1 heme-binding domain-containing protein [bacterium]